MTKAFWHWNSSSNPWNADQQQWTKYSDVENQIIEHAYQNHQCHVELDSFIIDFKHQVQKKKHDHNKQRPIKRILIESHKNLREERFLIPPKLTKTFTAYSISKSAFINEWITKNYAISNDIGKVVERAASGIIHEGNLLQQHGEAEWLAEQLIEVKSKSEEEIKQVCINLYTRESFLYKLLNKTLREDDTSKVDTLGPFAYLLSKSTSNLEKNRYLGTVYRGATLEPDMMNSYQQALHDGCRSWSGFTSTSKNRQNAEKFGNVLFIINILQNDTAVDVSSLSEFPQEEEVLINAGWNFSIDKIEPNTHGKSVVYIKQD